MIKKPRLIAKVVLVDEEGSFMASWQRDELLLQGIQKDFEDLLFKWGITPGLVYTKIRPGKRGRKITVGFRENPRVPTEPESPSAGS